MTVKLTILNLYCALLVIAGLSASCKKHISADVQEPGAEALTGIGPVAPYTWSELAIPGNVKSYPFNQPHAPIFQCRWAIPIIAGQEPGRRLWGLTTTSPLLQSAMPAM